MRTFLVLLFALGLLVLAGPAHADTTWLCKPGMAENPCRGSLATTVQSADGSSRVETPALPADPPVDCFYVYPTVSNQPGPNATLAADPEVKAIAEYQAARFSQDCDVYAPIYRQNTLLSIFTGGFSDMTRALAYGDVKAAFEEYLAQDNHGRGFMLIGHSQGSGMLRTLIRDTIDKDPVLRKRLVSAIVLGGNVRVKKGSDRGGDFANVPLCTGDDQFGCVVAYSTFNETPPPDAIFGRVSSDNDRLTGLPSSPDDEIACVNPASVAANAMSQAHPILRGEPFPPGLIAAGTVQTYGGVPPTARTPWLITPDRYEIRCERVDGAHVLMSRPLAGAHDLHPAPDATWGLHLLDVNGALGDLVALVGRQAKAYVAPPPAPKLRLAVSFTRGRDARGRVCARRDVLAYVTGADRRSVATTEFLVRGRRVARVGKAPFRATVRRARLTRGALRAVVARATLTDGRTARIVKRVRACA